MQQAINLIPSPQSNEPVCEAPSKANRNEPIVLDEKFLRMISGGDTDQPNKTW